jgi:hypothetical protein
MQASRREASQEAARDGSICKLTRPTTPAGRTEVGQPHAGPPPGQRNRRSAHKLAPARRPLPGPCAQFAEGRPCRTPRLGKLMGKLGQKLPARHRDHANGRVHPRAWHLCAVAHRMRLARPMRAKWRAAGGGPQVEGPKWSTPSGAPQVEHPKWSTKGGSSQWSSDTRSSRRAMPQAIQQQGPAAEAPPQARTLRTCLGLLRKGSSRSGTRAG